MNEAKSRWLGVEEVYTKSTLKLYWLAKDGTGEEIYVRSVQGEQSVKLLFRLRAGSAGLLEDKKGCVIAE